MNNNDQDNSKDLLTNKPEATFSNGTNITGSSDDINQKKINLNDESQSHLIESSIEEQNQDEFIRITAAHQMLIEAQTYDQQENYPLALHLYRLCVDFLLEELMFANGTDQSRIYLREKCTAIMDRIDILKTKLDPMLSSTKIQSSNNELPIDQLKTLDLS